VSVDSETIEHMFEHAVSLPRRNPPASRNRAATLGVLRQNINRLEHGQLPAPALPVLPGLDKLFPDGGLKPGCVYAIPRHTSVTWALIAEATKRGHQVATVGSDHLGFRAAHEYGVVLDRLIVLPRLQQKLWSTVASLADVVSLVVVHTDAPPPPPGARDALLGRARERECVLLVAGSWPQVHATVSVDAMTWTGLGQGNGVLTGQTLTLRYTPRHGAHSTTLTLIKDADGVRVDTEDVSAVRWLTPRESAGHIAGDQREAG